MSAPKKRTTFYIEDNLLKKFKVICVREGEKMSQKIENYMRGYVTRHEPGNPQLRIDNMFQLKITRECYCGEQATHEVWAKNGWHGFLCEVDLEKNKVKLKRIRRL